MFPVYDLGTPDGNAGLDACLERLRATTSAGGDAAKVVTDILADVHEHGDEALVRYVQRFSDPGFTMDRLRVSSEDLAGAAAKVEPALLDAIKTAIQQVREYQQHVIPEPTQPITIGGAELGLRFSPVDSVGIARAGRDGGVVLNVNHARGACDRGGCGPEEDQRGAPLTDTAR